VKLRMSLCSQKLISSIAIAAVLSSLAAQNATASRGDGSIGDSPRKPVPIYLPTSNYGGYIVIDSKKNVICGGSTKGSISLKNCTGELAAHVRNSRPTHAMINGEGTQTAGGPVLLIAGVACAGAGYIAASLEVQRNTILMVNATEQVQAVITATGGASAAISPARQITKRMIPKAGLLTRAVTATGIVGAICGASAAGGYFIFHFLYRQASNIGDLAK